MIVLFVDDDRSVLDGLRRLLRSVPGLSVLTADSGDAALALLMEQSVDVICSDLRMPGMDGLQLLEEVGRRHPAMRRYLLSGSVAQKRIEGLDGVIAKPCDRETLLALILGKST